MSTQADFIAKNKSTNFLRSKYRNAFHFLKKFELALAKIDDISTFLSIDHWNSRHLQTQCCLSSAEYVNNSVLVMVFDLSLVINYNYSAKGTIRQKDLCLRLRFNRIFPLFLSFFSFSIAKYTAITNYLIDNEISESENCLLYLSKQILLRVLNPRTSVLKNNVHRHFLERMFPWISANMFPWKIQNLNKIQQFRTNRLSLTY